MDTVLPIAVLAVAVAMMVFLVYRLVQASHEHMAQRHAERQARLEKQLSEAQTAIDRMEAVNGDLRKLPDLNDQFHGLILREMSGALPFAAVLSILWKVTVQSTLADRRE